MRMLRTCSLVLFASTCLVASLTSSSSADAPSQGVARATAPPSVTRFAWTVPCRVPVREQVRKDDHGSVLTYFVEVRPDPESRTGELTLRLVDFAFVSIDGNDATSREAVEALRPLLAATSAVPTTIVSADGHFLRTTGVEAMIDAVVALRAGTPEESERMRRVMSAPAFRATMEQTTSAYWRTWVENWIDFDLTIAPGETLEGDVPFEVGGRVDGTVHVITSRLANTPRGIVIRHSTSVDEAAFARSIGPMLQSLLSGAGVTLPGDLEVLHAPNSVVMEVETDPATLRPFRTHFEKRFSIEMAGGRTSSRVEIRDLTWDWSHALGCGLP